MYIVQTTATHSVTAVRLCTVVKSLQETDNLHELDKRKTWLCSDIGRLTLMTFPERKAFSIPHTISSHNRHYPEMRGFGQYLPLS